MNGAERADQHRAAETFPASWGKPPRGSEERTQWIRDNIQRDLARLQSSLDVRRALGEDDPSFREVRL